MSQLSRRTCRRAVPLQASLLLWWEAGPCWTASTGSLCRPRSPRAPTCSAWSSGTLRCPPPWSPQVSSKIPQNTCHQSHNSLNLDVPVWYRPGSPLPDAHGVLVHSVLGTATAPPPPISFICLVNLAFLECYGLCIFVEYKLSLVELQGIINFVLVKAQNTQKS